MRKVFKVFWEKFNMLSDIYKFLSTVKDKNKYAYFVLYKFFKVYFNIVYFIKYKLKQL